MWSPIVGMWRFYQNVIAMIHDYIYRSIETALLIEAVPYGPQILIDEVVAVMACSYSFIVRISFLRCKL